MKQKLTKDGSVWMVNDEGVVHTSAARTVAVDAMNAIGLDPQDWRQRDAVINGISANLTWMLDYVHKHGKPKKKL